MSWRLAEVQIDNFKSIRKCSIALNDGFSVLTGPNGSGKSCFLESIAFGLGADHLSLRASKVDELAGAEHKADLVKVTLSFQRQGIDQITIGTLLSGNQRQYFINGKKTTKQQFDAVLLERVGFSLHGCVWRIGQTEVNSILTSPPKKLFEIISFLAGTSDVLEAKRRAEAQARRSLNELASVEQLISKLTKEVRDDQEFARLYEQHDQLVVQHAQVASQVESMRTVWKLKCSVEQIFNLLQLITKWEEIRDSYQEMKPLHENQIKVLSELDQEMECLEDETATTHESLSKLRFRRQELEANLRKAEEVQHSKRSQQEQFRRLEKEFSSDAEMQEGKYRRIVEHRLPTITEELRQHLSKQQRLRELTSESEIVAFRQEILQEVMSECEHLNTVWCSKQALLDLTRNFLESANLDSQLLNKELNDLCFVARGSVEGLIQNSCFSTIFDDLLMWQNGNPLVLGDGSSEETNTNELTSSVHLLKKSLSRHIPQFKCWQTEISQIDEELQAAVSMKLAAIQTLNLAFTAHLEDVVFFADLIAFSDDPKRNATIVKYSKAIQVLLGPYLDVAIVANSGAAVDTLRLLEKSPKAFASPIRIWPVDRLRARENKALDFPKHLNGVVVIDPNSFIVLNTNFPENYNVALKRVLGNCLFIETDEMAEEMIRTFETNSIWKDVSLISCCGNRHSLGSLVVARGSPVDQQEKNSFVENLRRYSLLKSEVVVKKQMRRDLDTKLEFMNVAISVENKLQVILDSSHEKFQLLRKLQCEIESKSGVLRETELNLQEISRKLEEKKLALKLLHDDMSSSRDAQTTFAMHNRATCDLESLRDSLEEEASSMLESFTLLKDEISKLGSQQTQLSKELEDIGKVVDLNREQLHSVDCEINRRVTQQTETNEKLTGLKSLVAAGEQDSKCCFQKLCQDFFQLEQKCRGDGSNALKEVLFENKGSQSTAILQQKRREFDLLPQLQTVEFMAALKSLGQWQIDQLEQSLSNLTGACSSCSLPDLTSKLASMEENLSDVSFRIGASQRQLANYLQLKEQPHSKRRSRHSDVHEITSLSAAAVERHFAMLQERKVFLESIRSNYDQAKAAIDILAAGAKSVDAAVESLHSMTFKSIREKFRQYFNDLVPTREVDIVNVSQSAEAGFRFVLAGHNNGGAAERSDHVRSIEELSGGQRALLGISFLVACSMHRGCPVYLLDEVDAALDESNQRLVAAIIATLFKEKQVVCVSHHPSFLSKAMHEIRVMMKDGYSAITN